MGWGLSDRYPINHMTLKKGETIGIQESGVGFDKRRDKRKRYLAVWAVQPENGENIAFILTVYSTFIFTITVGLAIAARAGMHGCPIPIFNFR